MLLFQSWQEMLRILISATILYPLFILSIRLSGKRSTSKMNNFDWIVTVALGSILGSGLLLKKVPVAESGFAAILLLIFQYIVTKMSLHWSWVRSMVRANPQLLYYEGTYLYPEMKKERINQDEIEAVVREKGYLGMKEVGAVILESDASLSILPTFSKEDRVTILNSILERDTSPGDGSSITGKTQS